MVFDVGDVLIRYDPHPAIAAGVGDQEAHRFLSATDFDFYAWNHEQDAGRTFADAEAVVAQHYPHWLQHAQSYCQHFDKSLLGPVEDTVTILRELHHAGVPLYALTNFSAETFPLARQRFEFLDLFADIVVSGEVGIAKPAAEIFRLLQSRTGLAPSHCVFVDDTAVNVTAAAAAGFDAARYTGSAELRRLLHARGLPVAAPSPA